MWDYGFMKNVLITSAFVFILLMDVWGIGYWAVKLVRWVKKKLRGEKEPVEEAKS